MNWQCSNTSVAHWNSMTDHSNNPMLHNTCNLLLTTNTIIIIMLQQSAYYSNAVKLTDTKVATLLTL